MFNLGSLGQTPEINAKANVKSILNTILKGFDLKIDTQSIDNAIDLIYKSTEVRAMLSPAQHEMSIAGRFSFSVYKIINNGFMNRYPKNYNNLMFMLNMTLGFKYMVMYSFYERTDIKPNGKQYYNNIKETSTISLNNKFYTEIATPEPASMMKCLSQSAFYIALTNSTSNFIKWFNEEIVRQFSSNRELLTNAISIYDKGIKNGNQQAVIDSLLALICSLFLIYYKNTTNDIEISRFSIAHQLKDLEDIQINISTTSGQDEIDRLILELNNLKEKMKDLEKQIQEERNKYNEYRQGWNSAQFTDNKSPAQYRQEWDRDVKSKEDAETRASKLQDDLNKANDRIKALELEKSDVTAQIEQLNNIITELKKKLSECEDNKSQDVAKLNSDISSLQTEIAKLKATIAQLERDKKDLENTKAVLDTQIASQNKKISDLLKQIQTTLNEAYNKASDYNQKVISFNSSILGENSILKQIEEGWKEVIDKTVSNESELELSLTELENRIVEYDKKYGGIVDLRNTLDKTMQSAIENSQAMREFVYKITDNINGLLLSKKSLLGQSTTTVDNEVDALTNSITKIVKEISEMLANNNFDQEKVMKQITVMNEGVKGYFNDKMQVRFNNNKKINMLVDKIMEIVSKYPTPEEIKVLINENLNKLVYHFTKKALLAFDEIKNKMYNRY